MDGMNVGFNKVRAGYFNSTGIINNVNNTINVPIGKSEKVLSSATMAALENPQKGSFMDYLNKMSGLIDFSA